MAFDGFFTKKIVNELTHELINAKINKINNLSNNEFIISVRKYKNKKLLISTNPKNYRIHITKKIYENPYTPSNFCTVLRKYLINSTITNIRQVNNDRIIIFEIKNNDELGYSKNFKLIIELMSKHSNIILTDKDYKIINSIKNDYNIEYKRHTSINSYYKLPPTKEKTNPFEEINVEDNFYNDNKFFINNFYGFSLILNNYFLNKSKKYFLEFIENFDKINEPCIIKNENLKDYYFFNIYSNEEDIIKFDNYSELLDYYYSKEVSNNKTKEITIFIKNKLNRLNKKLEKLKIELNNISLDNNNLLKGQLLLANNYLFKKNIPSKIKLQNFYSENLEEIEIELNNNISIEKNAEIYFNKNKKNNRAITNLENQIKITKDEILYFENIHLQLQYADISDTEDIMQELNNLKYIKHKNNIKNNKPKLKKININGCDIYIGKSNIQNNIITNKLAKKNYLWFHAKDVAGSHIVIFNENPDEKTILIAATLAGYYSKNKNENTVLVDYTHIKYVKKISSNNPGLVSYKNQKTLKINIDISLINKYI